MNKIKNMTFSQAVEGYQLFFEARHRSAHTLMDYMNTFRKFSAFLKTDRVVDSISHVDIQGFLVSQKTVADKTVANYHTGLSAMWTWLVSEGLATEHIVHKVARPGFTKTAIEPFSEDEIRAMFNCLKQSKVYIRRNQGESSHTLGRADRNRAIMLLLLDTGMRASELCGLQIYHVDLKQQQARVLGKGNKERILPFSSRTGQAIWKYLVTRQDEAADAPLFVSHYGNELGRDALYKLFAGIGERAQVRGVHPHRFRHTFAIMYLRNGGDAYTLQKILGHTTLEMVRTYISISSTDLRLAHKRSSPVDRMRL